LGDSLPRNPINGIDGCCARAAEQRDERAPF
jgi:hypothetical protein